MRVGGRFSDFATTIISASAIKFRRACDNFLREAMSLCPHARLFFAPFVSDSRGTRASWPLTATYEPVFLLLYELPVLPQWIAMFMPLGFALWLSDE